MGRNDEVGRHLHPRFDEGVVGIALGAVNDVDRGLALADLGAKIADMGVDPKIARRREHRLELQPPKLGVETLVHLRPLPELPYLKTLIVVSKALVVHVPTPR